MPYGTIKVDNITFTDGGVDKSVAISGLVQNPTFTGNVTVTGTVSGATVRATTVSGVTISGTTVNAASGVFTTQISGAVVVAPAGLVGAPSVQVGTGASIAPGFYGAGTDQLGISTGGSSRLVIDSVGQIRVVTLGSAAAPALVVGNDVNTGIYSPGADQVAISTNGIGRLFIDSSGGVGIGTVPSVQLHLAGPARIGLNNTDDAELQIGAGATGNRNAYIDLVGDTTYTDYGLRLIRPDAGPNTSSYLLNRGTGTLYITAQDAGDVGFQTNNITRAFFSGAAFKLTNSTDIRSDVNTDKITIFGGNGTGANIEMFGGSHAVEPSLMTLDAAEHRIRSQDGTSERVRIDSSGRLLVGTSTAANTGALTVNGDISLYTGGTTVGRQGTYALGVSDNGTLGQKAQIAFAGTGTNGFLTNIVFSNFNGDFFNSGLVERARIDSSGKVGIGASAPLEFVDIRRPNGAGDLAVRLVHEGQVEYKIGIKDSDDKLYITNNNGNTALGATTGIIITSTGSVGINTASPGAALDVQGNIRLSASTPNIEFNNGGPMIYGPSANTLAFATGGGVSSPVEKARIDSSGRLLVGTSSRRRVGTLFDPIGGVFYEGSTISSYEAFTAVVNRTDNVGAVLSFGKSGGSTNGSNTIVANGDQLGVIRFSGADGTDLESRAAEISAEVDGTPGSNDMPGRLVFSTTVDGASSPEERMRITSGGTIRIGQSTTDTPGFGNTTTGIGMEPNNGALFLSRADGGCLLFLNSNLSTGTADAMNFRRSNVFVGSVTTTTTSTAYNTSSDYRLKENVTAVTDGIARLQQLKPSRFNFIADPTKTVDGFLAHEVQSVVPEAITGEKDAVNDDGNPVYQGIDQSKLVPLVVAALQEALERINLLEAKVASLESK